MTQPALSPASSPCRTSSRSPLTAVVALLVVPAMLWPSAAASAARHDGKLTIRVIDEQSGQQVAARMELRNGRGRPVRVRAAGAVSSGDYFVFDGQVTLQLGKGPYQFLIEAGPEYQTRPGHFTILRHAEDTTEVVLRRRVDMQAEGWWAADLDVRQRHEDLPLLMRAARVNLVPVFVRENLRGKCQNGRMAANAPGEVVGETLCAPKYALDHRRGGGLLILDEAATGDALDVCHWKADDSSLVHLQRADASAATIIALNPYAWDLPLWIAAGKLDAIQIIHRNSLVDDAIDHEGWDRKRSNTFFPGKAGNGRWSEAIYHHLLNCGIQIPPAAGSGSGANKNPVGTNRVYVHCGENFTLENWLAGLRAGNVMVTNGPLLRTQVSGQPPGHQFHLDNGESRDFQIALGLAFYEKAPVEYLELVKNGRVVHEIRLDELAKQQGRLPKMNFDSSGWFLVRAMTSTTNNYQFASTGPYYVEANNQPRISRESVEFFVTWLDAAEIEFADNQAVLAEISAARPYWEDLLGRANAD